LITDILSQAYMLVTVLSSTADDVTEPWKGLLLILFLFVANILATATFVAGSTIGHITGELSFVHSTGWPKKVNH